MIEVPLTKGAIALIDDEDADLAMLSWHLHSEGYAVRKPKTGLVRLHRVILERKLGRPLLPNEDTDHINRIRTDDRRDNLRVATRTQNCANRALQSRNTSGYRGVSWSKVRQKWQVLIRINGRNTYLGCYDDIEEANRAYQERFREIHGEEWTADSNVRLPEQNYLAADPDKQLAKPPRKQPDDPHKSKKMPWDAEHPRPTQHSDSQYPGVSRVSKSYRWQARIMVNGKRVVIGHFDSQEEAAAAYQAKALELRGSTEGAK